jgi:hypothetical protein
MWQELLEFIRQNDNGEGNDTPINGDQQDEIMNFIISTDNPGTNDFETPLISALIRRGEFNLARQLAVVEGVNLNAVDTNNRTVLQYAREHEHDEDAQAIITIIQRQLNPQLLEFLIEDYNLGGENDLENDLFDFGMEIGNENILLILETGGRHDQGMHALLNNDFITVNDLRDIYNHVINHGNNLANIIQDYVAIVNHDEGGYDIASDVLNQYQNDDAAFNTWLHDN